MVNVNSFNPEDFDVKATRKLLAILNSDIAKNPILSEREALVIVKNLVTILNRTVDVIEQLKVEIEINRALASGVGSTAKN